MKSEKKINESILKITMKIKDQFPELSPYILEMPVTIPNIKKPKINSIALQDYYKSLKVLLKDYIENQNTASKKMNKLKKLYGFTEVFFERLVFLATAILGNSVTFIIAFCLVLFWWANNFSSQDVHQIVGDIIFGTTFLSLFIIQKSFNRFSGSLHLKINELVSSHESANNSVINAEEKTEREIIELSKEYTELAEQVKVIEEGNN